MDVALIIHMNVGPLPRFTASGDIAPEKLPQSKCFKQCVTLSMQDTRKDIFLRGGKGIQTECVFRRLLAGTVSVLRCEITRAGLRA